MSAHFSKNHPLSLAFLPSGVLALAHAITGLALLTFGMRAGGYPLHPIGLMIYLVTVALSFVILGFQFFYPQPTWSVFTRLFAVSWPALVSLVLAAMFWLTPWLGGAPYAPYDPADSDGIAFLSLLFALAFATTALLYGSFKYGLFVCAAQVVVYFGAYTLPHWFRYPANFWGVRPSILGEMLGIYALAFGLMFVRAKLKWVVPQNLSIAALATNLVGALALYHLLAWLPDNGAYLGYVSGTTFVPQSAWDWSRPAAQTLAILVVLVALLLGIGMLFRKPSLNAT